MGLNRYVFVDVFSIPLITNGPIPISNRWTATPIRSNTKLYAPR